MQLIQEGLSTTISQMFNMDAKEWLEYHIVLNMNNIISRRV